MAHIDDRWHRTVPDPDRPGKTKKERTPRYGKGKRWRVRWIDPSGVEREKAFINRDEAESHLANTHVRIEQGSYIDPSAGKDTVAQWGQKWLGTKRHLAPKTVQDYQDLWDVQVVPQWGS